MYKFVLSFLFTYIINVNESFGLTILNTDELKWKLFNQNRSIQVEARVPGGVYGALMDAGIFNQGDFYYRFNDINYRYISYENWTYVTTFEITNNLFQEERIALELEGLDTISNINLNGKLIGKSDNMFVPYVFDVKDYLKKENLQTLEVAFQSPVLWAKEMYERQAESYIVPPKCVDPAFKGECHANHIRKMQSSFSWDWGPAFPNSGIWKSWNLIGWSTLRIKSILFFSEPASSSFSQFTNRKKNSIGWKIKLKIKFESAVINRPLEGNLKIELENKIYLSKKIVVNPKNFTFFFTEQIIIREGIVDLWWPNGYGSQPLYNLSVTWSSNQTKETSNKTIRIGFRTVELDQSFVDNNNQSLGRYFRFKINNITMFMKGSNWIPAHILPEKMNPTYIRRILTDAKRSHQNCIRVWGGGIYESDSFYENADELGILIWQDFMFACSMYPTNENFLQSVAKEVELQIDRLQHHPSILVWAGNNENEAALRGNWYGTGYNFNIYKKDYIDLYVNVIKNIVSEQDSSRPFVVSSPSNGIESENEGYVAKNPYDNRYGDVHFYNYDKNGWNWTIYPKTRFASEYGFQSWPSFRTLENVTIEEDRRKSSNFIKSRQHHPLGNIQLILQLATHFDLYKLLNNTSESFRYYIYLTQVNQAMSMKTETEFYRRCMSDLTEDGQGFTAGALYWQLNDIWQGASWSSIEFGGRWKILHYFAMSFFRPILLSPSRVGDQVTVIVINDLLEDIHNLKINVKIISYLQLQPLQIFQYNVPYLKAQHSTKVLELDLAKNLSLYDLCYLPFKDPQNICFLSFELQNGDYMVDQNATLLLCEPKDAALKEAVVQITNISSITNTKYEIILKTNEIALFVWLETDFDGEFSDNGFHLTDVDTIKVFFHAHKPMSVKDLIGNINITSISDTVHF